MTRADHDHAAHRHTRGARGGRPGRRRRRSDSTTPGVRLADGDVVVVSSKVASKALGLVTHDPDKDRVVRGETEYVVAERSVGEPA